MFSDSDTACINMLANSLHVVSELLDRVCSTLADKFAVTRGDLKTFSAQIVPLHVKLTNEFCATRADITVRDQLNWWKMDYSQVNFFSLILFTFRKYFLKPQFLPSMHLCIASALGIGFHQSPTVAGLSTSCPEAQELANNMPGESTQHGRRNTDTRCDDCTAE
jgi:hypothetical protein